MEKCKDCIHFEMCTLYAENPCNHFLDVSKMVALPCKVGAIVYGFRVLRPVSGGKRMSWSWIDTKVFLQTCVLFGREISIEQKSFVKSDITRIGSTIFLTKEEAENELKKRKEQ